MAGSKTKLLRPHEAGRGRLARHYGDGFGKHLLPAVGRRLASCMGLAQVVVCHPMSREDADDRTGAIAAPLLE